VVTRLLHAPPPLATRGFNRRLKKIQALRGSVTASSLLPFPIGDGGAPLAFSFGERERIDGEAVLWWVVRVAGFCRGRRGNGDNLSLWGKWRGLGRLSLAQGKGKALVR